MNVWDYRFCEWCGLLIGVVFWLLEELGIC